MRAKMCGVVLGSAICILSAQAAETNLAMREGAALRLSLDLVDGSHIVGIPAIESVPVETSFAKMNIPLKQILTIKMGEDHETVSLALRNGDKLKGVVSLAPFKLATIFGDVAVGIESIKAFRVSVDHGVGAASWDGGRSSPQEHPEVVIETSMGTIKVELWPDKAPKTVENFLTYSAATFYEGTLFHRVIGNFMIQGGGMDADLRPKPTRDPIKNEARTDTPNKRGTLSMARTATIDSGTAQFFINLVDNAFLDHNNETAQGYGYCVFGQVTEGMDVVDNISRVQTANKGPFQNVPVQPVIIKSITKSP